VSYVIAALFTLAAVTMLNLLLTMAVIRRLRQHDELLATGGLPPLAAGEPGPEVGESIGDFTAVATDGSVLSRADVADATVGFFTPDCEPCRRLVPTFKAYAEANPDRRDRTIAVVVGRAADCAQTVRTLTAVSRVVVEPPGVGAMQAAFRISEFPSVVRVTTDLVIRETGADPTILASGDDVVAVEAAGRS
jgi:thiol-disulfide isomerase/thioredoxin